MEGTRRWTSNAPTFVPTPTHIVELERASGDEIAEVVPAHLDAATARLLDLIRVLRCPRRAGGKRLFAPAPRLAHVAVSDSTPRAAAAAKRSPPWRGAAGDAATTGAGARPRRICRTRRVRALHALSRLLRAKLALLASRLRPGTAEHVERIVRGWRPRGPQGERESGRRPPGAHREPRTPCCIKTEDGYGDRPRAAGGRRAGALLMQGAGRGRARRLLSAGRARSGPRDGSAGTAVFVDAYLAEPPTMAAAARADALGPSFAETALHQRDRSSRPPAERYQVVGATSMPRSLADPDRAGASQSSERGYAHFRGDVVQRLGVRCDPGGDATRSRWPGHRNRCGGRGRFRRRYGARAFIIAIAACRFPGCGATVR